jgi:hypothetical protein
LTYEQKFHGAAARHAMTQQPCGKYARVVKYQQIARNQVIDELGECGVVSPTARTVEHEKPGLTARGRGLLSYQLIR